VLSGGLLFEAALGIKISHGRWSLVFGAIISMIYGLLCSRGHGSDPWFSPGGFAPTHCFLASSGSS
jgi:hypothetical protein